MAILSGAQDGKTAPAAKEIQNLPENVKTQARDAGGAARAATEQLLDKATQHRPESQAAPTNRGDSKEAMMHTQGTPGKAQEAMSPTDHHKGQTQSQAKAPSKGQSPGR